MESLNIKAGLESDLGLTQTFSWKCSESIGVPRETRNTFQEYEDNCLEATISYRISGTETAGKNINGQTGRSIEKQSIMVMSIWIWMNWLVIWNIFFLSIYLEE